jgi:3-deoxy-D-manno-octulosonic-acid transferase
MFFFLFYNFLAIFLYFASLPILAILTTFNKKYKQSIPSRFFLKNTFSTLKNLQNNSIWFHVCSLGEANSIKIFVKELLKKNPNQDILISVITNTGYQTLAETKNNRIKIIYLPFEPLLYILFFYFKVKRKIPKKLIVLEAELWFLLFYLSKKFHLETTLLNARISTRSFPKYKKIAFFYKRIFKYIDNIFVQSEEDLFRFNQLGAEKNKLKVTGNIKTITNFNINSEPLIDKNSFQKEIIIGASTHENEEILIFSAFLKYQNKNNNSILILVPRHIERIKNILFQIKKINHFEKNIILFSEIDILNKNDMLKSVSQNDIIIVDKFGFLIELYRISDTVILGGSLVKNIGGHNPIEVVYFENKLISGNQIFNQKALFELLENVEIIDIDTLSDEEKISQIYKSLLNTRKLKSKLKYKPKSFNYFYQEVLKL